MRISKYRSLVTGLKIAVSIAAIIFVCDYHSLAATVKSSTDSSAKLKGAPARGKVTANTFFKLYDPGVDRVVRYELYGTFKGAGTFDYKYTIKDASGLAQVSGEGIDPSRTVYKDPAYQRLKNSGKLKGSQWDHVGTANPQVDFFVWATATKENPGVRLFFTAKALEAAGLYNHAIKAYRAAMILYPDAACWNREKTWTWLIAPAAWGEIINLTRNHPELNLKLINSYVDVEHAIKGNPTKNRVAVKPGNLIRYTAENRKKDYVDVSRLKIVKKRGGKVACVEYSNGQWGLTVNGKPYIVKGVHYAPTRVGEDYKWNWMYADHNGNKKIDTPYEAWIDANKNDRQDRDEPSVGDFAILKDMGCNTIRIFNTNAINKEVLRDMYKKYGIRVLLCDPFGAYTVHSGADWAKGTDYSNKIQRAKMRDFVKKMVMEYKDEEWLLGYILGNENNMPCDYSGVNASRTRAASQPKIYAQFLNEVAAMAHKLDPDHPVGVGNMGLGLVEEYAKYAPELDFIGVNDYPGSNGFGALWISARHKINRPILITEFGCDAYHTGKGPDENAQARYILNNWRDIYYNQAGKPGEGNSIGGLVFEYLDEWWKDTRADPLGSQNTEPTCEMAFPDGWSQEEWLGIVGQGEGRKSPFLRQPRKAYYMLQKLWK